MSEAGRIKGANSDYRYTPQGLEKTEGEDAYLRIFICPLKQPARSEVNDGNYCQGDDVGCPSPGADKSGHALVLLHEKDGVTLVTNGGNRLHVGQDGAIRLLAARTAVVSAGDVTIEVSADGGIVLQGDTRMNGNLTIEGDLHVSGRIVGDGALSIEQEELLRKLAGVTS